MRARKDLMLTVTDLESMPEDGNRYEVIDGDLHVSTAPSYWHQYCLIEVAHQMKLYLSHNPIGEVIPGIGIIFDAFNGVIPDLVYFSMERKNAMLAGGRLTGAPELVIEILSPGSKNEARDKAVKRKLYSDNGVSEYWILDPESRSVEQHRAAKTGGFKSKQVVHADGVLTTPLLPGFRLEVAKLFASPGAKS